jgi:hypothetical protein
MKKTSWGLPEEGDDQHFFSFEGIIGHPYIVALEGKKQTFLEFINGNGRNKKVID